MTGNKEEINLITYGIFDGVAKSDYLVAVAVPDYETWKQISGKNSSEEYLDFLLEQEDAVEEIEDVVKTVRIPLDLDEYRTWLSRNTFWKDGPEARSAWALEVVNSNMNELLKKRPVVPRPPENREDVDIYYGVAVATLADIEDVGKLGRTLDRADEMAQILTKSIPGLVSFRKISRLRADGVRIMVCSRMILTNRADDAEDFLFQTAKTEEKITLPRRLRIKKDDLADSEFPAVVVLLIPVVFHGGRDVLDFCEGYLESCNQYIPEFSEATIKAINDLFDGRNVTGGDVPLVPFYELFYFLEHIAEAAENLEEENAGDKKRKKRNLKRIK